MNCRIFWNIVTLPSHYMTSYPPEDRKPSLLYLKEAVFCGTKVLWSFGVHRQNIALSLWDFKLHDFFQGTGKRPCMYVTLYIKLSIKQKIQQSNILLFNCIYWKCLNYYCCTLQLYYYYYYYWYSALGPVWAETRVQSGDWYGSGTLHPGQVLRGSLPLLSPAF